MNACPFVVVCNDGTILLYWHYFPTLLPFRAWTDCSLEAYDSFRNWSSKWTWDTRSFYCVWSTQRITLRPAEYGTRLTPGWTSLSPNQTSLILIVWCSRRSSRMGLVGPCSSTRCCVASKPLPLPLPLDNHLVFELFLSTANWIHFTVTWRGLLLCHSEFYTCQFILVGPPLPKITHSQWFDVVS